MTIPDIGSDMLESLMNGGGFTDVKQEVKKEGGEDVEDSGMTLKTEAIV
jgi:hypothetical protein